MLLSYFVIPVILLIGGIFIGLGLIGALASQDVESAEEQNFRPNRWLLLLGGFFILSGVALFILEKYEMINVYVPFIKFLGGGE